MNLLSVTKGLGFVGLQQSVTAGLRDELRAVEQGFSRLFLIDRHFFLQTPKTRDRLLLLRAAV